MTQKPTRRARRGKTDDGFIIVAVLWILGALATLASVYAFYVANTTIAVAVNDDRIQAEALIAAGVELAVYQISVTPETGETGQLGDDFSFRLGNANVAVAYRPENARIDLNAAAKPLLAGLFRTLGATDDNANIYADRIIGWRTAPNNANPEGESSLYKGAGLNYGPRGAPFAHVDELWLVAGLPPAFVERALPFVTVYSGQPDVNFRAAAPEVLASLPGMTPERLTRALEERNQPAAAAGNAAGPAVPTTPGGQSLLAQQQQASKTSRIVIRLDFDNRRRVNAEVVVLNLKNGKEPYRILSWRDDFDGRGLNGAARTTLQ